jgi:hypothetical protein
MWSMSQDDGLPFAVCPNCDARYPCVMDSCRRCEASLCVIEPREDGTRKVHLLGTLTRAVRQEMSRQAAEARRRRRAA